MAQAAAAAATAAHVSASFRPSIARDASGTRSNARSRVLTPTLSSKSPLVVSSSFARGSPLVVQRSSSPRKSECKAASFCIRCEQSTKGNSAGLDVWVGRLAMIGFVSAVTVEIVTGKGLLENIGLPTPLPTVALAVTALVGVLLAFFIFQSASKD